MHMIDQNRFISKPLGYSLVGLSLFFGIAEILLFSFAGDKPPHYNQTITYIVFALSLVIVPLLTLAAMKYQSYKLPAIVSFHLLFGLLLVWFSEIMTPFTALWSIMMLYASTYYGWRGFISSGVFLAVLAALYCTLFYDDLSGNKVVYLILSAMVVLMTVFTSFLFVRVIIGNIKKNRELMSAQRSEQMQVNRLNTLLNGISDAVLTLNRYGRITSQNAAAQVFFDTNQSLIGRDIATLLKPLDQLDTEVDMHELIDSVKSTMLRDDLSITSAGSKVHLSMQMSRIRSTFDDNEEYGVVVIIRDITKQKSLEEEKDEFISVASHELRTPVAIAEGSLSNLLVMYGKNADMEILHAASKTAYDQIIYLSKIINDLSTLSRAERGVGDTIEEIDVKAMLHDLYGRYEPEAKEKELRLDLDVDTSLPHVETSRLYLEEIMQNFITNAIKYTKEGSITISAKLSDGNGRIVCSVTDTGIGISKSDLEHIFEKFYRSEDYRTRETSGTGLGLYVVQKLADKLETKIEVESRLNHGSTFSFVLPLKSTTRSVSHAPVTRPKQTAPKLAV